MSQAKLTISAFTSTKGNDGVVIFIEDEISRTRLVTVTISHEEFSRALGHLGHRPCEIEFTPDNYGKRHEIMTRLIFIPDGRYEDREARAKKACAPFEVDGWRARYSDSWNMHNRVTGGYMVTFDRYVK